MNSSPARGSSERLPSVLKKELPTKSGTVSASSASTRTNPGLPPRWETSTPCAGALPPRAAGWAVAMKNVSASRIMRRAAASSRSERCTAFAAAAPPTYSGARAWMYFGQLPKLWRTPTENPWSVTRPTTPFMRLRRRVCGSMPSRPIGAPSASVPASGSPAGGSARTTSSRGSGDSMNPGGFASTEAHGCPCASTMPTITNGNFAKNSRCCSGMKSQNTRGPSAATLSRTPARSWTAHSPSWNAGGDAMTGAAAGSVERLDPDDAVVVVAADPEGHRRRGVVDEHGAHVGVGGHQVLHRGRGPGIEAHDAVGVHGRGPDLAVLVEVRAVRVGARRQLVRGELLGARVEHGRAVAAVLGDDDAVLGVDVHAPRARVRVGQRVPRHLRRLRVDLADVALGELGHPAVVLRVRDDLVDARALPLVLGEEVGRVEALPLAGVQV